MGGYPVVLDLRARQCLVIGPPDQAGPRAEALEAAGAVVTRTSQYQPGCLAGFFVVVVADYDRSLNDAIFAEAAQTGALINCVDDPPHCNFYFPALMRHGELSIAISTAGACPALAVRLKERIAGVVGPEYGALTEIARAGRGRVKGESFEERRARWYALVDSDILDLLRRGDRAGAERRAAEILGYLPNV
jgi:siroheme synthase-like protein